MGLSGTGTSHAEVRNGGVLSAAGGMTIGPLGTVRGDGTIVANVMQPGGLSLPALPARRPARCTSPAITSSRVRRRSCKSNWPRRTSFDKLAVTGNIRWQPLRPAWRHAAKSRWPMATCRTAASRSTFSTGAAASAACSQQILLPTLGGTLVWDTSQLYINGTTVGRRTARISPATTTRTARSTRPTTSCGATV